MQSDLYFLALVPPQPKLRRLQVIKERFAQNYDCQVALRSPPHITLIPPFRLNPAEIDHLKRHLDHWSKTHFAFEVQLDGYGNFSPRVIFLNVIPNLKLSNLQIQLQQQVKQAPTLSHRDVRPFKPHLTLGTRDLNKGEFHRAWSDLEHEKIKVSWPVDGIVLLKHNGKTWDVSHFFALGRSQTGSGKIQSE